MCYLFRCRNFQLMNYSYCGQICVFKWYSLAEKRRFVCWSVFEQTQTRLCSVRLWDGLCPPSSCKCKRAQTKNHYRIGDSYPRDAAWCLGGARLPTRCLPGNRWRAHWPFQSRENHVSCRALQSYKLPSDWAIELFKLSTDSASLVVEIEKKFFLVFGGGFSGGNTTNRGVLGYLYLALGSNPLDHYYGSRFFWKRGQNPCL